MDHDLAFKRGKDGAVQFIYHPNDQIVREVINSLGTVRGDKRAGYVWPLSGTLCVAFRLLRKAFGSRGPVADWTRSWRCRWIVVNADTMTSLPGIYDSHNAAVETEIRWSLSNQDPTFGPSK